MTEPQTIEEIKKLITEDNQEADTKFSTYITSINQLHGNYLKSKWEIQWRKNIYKLGEIFNSNSSNKDASQFITIINKQLDLEENEALHFIKAEISLNYYPQNSGYTISYIKKLLKKYPSNPEFHHSYSKCLIDDQKAISECKLALKIEPDNREFLLTSLNREKKYLDKLLLEGKILEAEKQIENMESFKLYEKEYVFNNIIVSLGDRINDHKIIDKKISGIDNLISTKSEEERKRLIEVLGIFVAILGFIFTNINIALQISDFKEMRLLMLEMAVIFLIFGISMSYIFQKDKKTFFKEGKFWILIGLFGLIILGIKFL